MGRKLIGLTIGFFLSIAMAYFLFPASYNEIIYWLAPYLGHWLRFFFMYLFLIFGHPIYYPTVLVAWVVIGLIAGLFVRSIWGTIPVVIFIFGLTFLMMIVGLAAVFLPLILTGAIGSIDFMAMLANIPPGVSLFDILNAPVIGPIISAITGGIGDITGGGGVFDPSTIMGVLQNILVNTIILPVVLNFIILLIAAIIGGVIGRAIFPVHD
jgi:hypothetical protein